MKPHEKEGRGWQRLRSFLLLSGCAGIFRREPGGFVYRSAFFIFLPVKFQ